jgi:hypothetical protein
VTEFSWFDALPPAEPGRPPERLSWAAWNAREDAREAAARAVEDERAVAVREAAKLAPSIIPPVRRPLDVTCAVCGLRSECGWVGVRVVVGVCPRSETPEVSP